MTRLLPTSTIVKLRQIQGTAMPDTCDIYHAVETQDALLETTTGYAGSPDINDEPCRFVELTGEELVAAQREGINATALVALAITVDVRNNDRLTLLGKTWTVDRVTTVSAWSTVKRAYIRLEEAV